MISLELVRCRKSVHGTFGRLFVDDKFECYTLEPPPNDCKPCPIPIGTYKVVCNVPSPKFCLHYPYYTFAGCIPRLLGVPNFKGILIHIGNFSRDTQGCILVGKQCDFTRLFESTRAYLDLWNKIYKCKNISITISDL